MSLEIKGRLFTTLAQKTGQGQNGEWLIQEFVIETTDQFPKKICLEAWNDQGKVIQTIQQGTEITVSFNPESKEYQGKWYTKLKVWKIVNASGQSIAPVSNGGLNAPLPPTGNVPPPFDGDLPF